MLGVDLLVDLECVIEERHASVAGSNHETPLALLWLDLRSALEEQDGALVLVLLHVVHAQARNHIQLGWIVSIRLHVIVHSLELVLLLLVEVAHLCENF